MSYMSEHFRIPADPVASSAAVVRSGNARFTVLTSRLVRMEYSSDGTFEDRATQVFWRRHLPAPDYTVTEKEGGIELETEHLRLRYGGGAFTADSLSVELTQGGTTWRFGDRDTGNLRGTGRTLDGADGRIRLEKGLLSRDGWAIVDDLRSLVFNDEFMLENRNAGEDDRDLYFFGYGHDYKTCLQDYCRVAGGVPLLPRWALGNWWSRYWEYTQDSLARLMEAFEERQIPLSVCIIDMDWHLVKGLPTRGWTGYTWNRDLFPDPEGFLSWLHEHGLKTALNLHPASGVHPHEAMYEDMARFMGVDPSTREPIPFDITDPRFIEAYFKFLHHSHEATGIDFWWLDWQQGTSTKLYGLDPLWMLNHLHFLDHGRDESRRPFIFSRWCGLGGHRYPIGFSGDTVVSWDSLRFQPEFTATAANVQFGWWSHDIGGHFMGVNDDELIARWVQFGVFSPIMRLHASKDFFQDRRPWVHREDVYHCTSRAMRWRHALVPYLYSLAWRNAANGLPPVFPMYHEHPEEDAAYTCSQQYYFGTELVVAPFVDPCDPELGVARQAVWLPEGDWFDFFTGEHVEGGRHRAVYGGLNDIPVFAKAGAIVPLATDIGSSTAENPRELEVRVFPGAGNVFGMYEDDGETQRYLQGDYAVTRLQTEWRGDELVFTVHPPEGTPERVAPVKRRVVVRFMGVTQPDRCEVQRGDADAEETAVVRDDDPGVTVVAENVAPADKVSVRLQWTTGEPSMPDEDNALEKVQELLWTFDTPVRVKSGIRKDCLAFVKGEGNGEEWVRTRSSWLRRAGLSTRQYVALLETLTGRDLSDLVSGM